MEGAVEGARLILFMSLNSFCEWRMNIIYIIYIYISLYITQLIIYKYTF